MMVTILLIACLFLNSAFSCTNEEFQCSDKTCITQNFRCDNFKDCVDGSDEVGCLKTGCKSDEFRCGDGMCITNEFRCDHFDDCKDGTDEIGCNVHLKPTCTKGCKEPTLLYEDLDCKPRPPSRENCCPPAFDCSHIEARANLVEDKCRFHGKSYNIGEAIPDSELYGSCYSNCTCRKSSSEGLTFDCKPIKCPEWFFHNNRPGCHLKYEPGKCCSTGQFCDSFSSSCKIGDKSYFDGQRFEHPTEKCQSCVCKASSVSCSKYQCMQEIEHQREIMKFCAPSYLTMNDCCPINWICPQNDNIMTSKMIRKPKLKCRFGNVQLNVGDKFKRIHKPSGGKIVCDCRVPPYLTCIQDYRYPIKNA